MRTPGTAALVAILMAGSAAFWLLRGQTPNDPFDGVEAGSAREIGGLRFCWAPPGSFRMGSPAEEPERRADEEQVSVTFPQGFWMAKYEVTQGEWLTLMGAHRREPDKGKGPDIPVYWVSWDDATEFCRRLTTRAQAARSLPDGWEIRLPTEAQWEYACRAGTTTATSFGPRLDATHANIGTAYPGGRGGRSQGGSVKVGSYPANRWGLHDMHGNVWEYCRDWYHRRLPGGVAPELFTELGEKNRDGTYSRVRRGGAWVEDGWANRSAMRLRYEPHRGSDHIGFRVAAVRP